MADYDAKAEVRKSTKKEPATLKTASSKGQPAEGTKTLHHITITPTEPSEPHGPPGFHLEHHYDSSGSMGAYHEPEEHAFTPGHGAKMIKHLKHHLGLAFSDATGAGVNETEEE